MTTDIPAWFGRTFPAPYPVDLLPNLRARLSGTAARLDEAVRGRLPETLSLGPPGKWSAEEHVWHLVEIEALWLARVEDFLAERHQLTPANLTHRKPAEAEPGAGPLADALREFRAARTRLLKRVDGLDPSRFTLALPHPRLRTPMRLADHLNFVAEHDDHHLAHILALRAQYVKLDRSWIQGIETEPAKRALVAGLQGFAAETGASLIAEGIETAAQLDAVRALGIAYGQGYLLGRPGDL